MALCAALEARPGNSKSYHTLSCMHQSVTQNHEFSLERILHKIPGIYVLHPRPRFHFIIIYSHWSYLQFLDQNIVEHGWFGTPSYYISILGAIKKGAKINTLSWEHKIYAYHPPPCYRPLQYTHTELTDDCCAVKLPNIHFRNTISINFCPRVISQNN